MYCTVDSGLTYTQRAAELLVGFTRREAEATRARSVLAWRGDQRLTRRTTWPRVRQQAPPQWWWRSRQARRWFAASSCTTSRRCPWQPAPPPPAAATGRHRKKWSIYKKVAHHTRLPNVGFRSLSRISAVSLQVTWGINTAVGCHYFPPGPQLPSQPSRGLLLISLFGEQRHDGCEQFA